MEQEHQTSIEIDSTAILPALQSLIDVVAKLRDPDGGCPWDLAQTPDSLTPYIVEEAYEAVHAIRSGDRDAIVSELGDLLLQVVLQSQLASEAGQFTLEDVAQSISEKLYPSRTRPIARTLRASATATASFSACPHETYGYRGSIVRM